MRGLFGQSGGVWAVAFACVVAFMGNGLVDPILPALAPWLAGRLAESHSPHVPFLVGAAAV